MQQASTTEKSHRVLRSFKFDDKTYHLISPSVKVTTEAKYRYSAKFSKLLIEGIPTRKQLQKNLESSPNSFVSDFIAQQAELDSKIRDLEKQLTELTDPKEIEIVASALLMIREQYFNQHLELQAIYSNTADVLAEEEKLNFLAAHMIVDENHKHVWETVDDFVKDTNLDFIETCKQQIVLYENGLASDWNSNFPEVKILNGLKEKRKEELEAKEKDSKKEEPKPAKKVTKKRVKKTSKNVETE